MLLSNTSCRFHDIEETRSRFIAAVSTPTLQKCKLFELTGYRDLSRSSIPLLSIDRKGFTIVRSPARIELSITFWWSDRLAWLLSKQRGWSTQGRMDQPQSAGFDQIDGYIQTSQFSPNDGILLINIPAFVSCG